MNIEDGEKSSQKNLSDANEARSAPYQRSGIASFIMPDSLADIFGDDYKPQPEPEIKKPQPPAKESTKKL